MAMKYLFHLQERLGFRCVTIKELDGEGNDGVQFNSMVDHIENCSTDIGTIRDSPECTCDMAVGGWSQNSERFGRVDYLPPFVIDGIGIVVHVDYTSSASAGAIFITAFPFPVWLLVLVLIMVFTVLKVLDKKFEAMPEPYKPLPDTESLFRRVRHFLQKKHTLRRLRKALQSVCMFSKAKLVLWQRISQSDAELHLTLSHCDIAK